MRAEGDKFLEISRCGAWWGGGGTAAVANAIKICQKTVVLRRRCSRCCKLRRHARAERRFAAGRTVSAPNTRVIGGRWRFNGWNSIMSEKDTSAESNSDEGWRSGGGRTRHASGEKRSLHSPLPGVHVSSASMRKVGGRPCGGGRSAFRGRV